MRVAEPDPKLTGLPDDVRATARVFHNGEVAWPNDDAEVAINALAANGNVILGLDARTLYPDGGVMEVPVSAWETHADSLPTLPSSAPDRRHSMRSRSPSWKALTS